MGLKRKNGLIIGLEHKDFYYTAHMIKVIESVSKLDNILFKIKPHHMMSPSFIEYLKKVKNPIIYDPKLAEVGDYVDTEINHATNNGFEGIIVHGFLRNTVLQCIEKTKDSKLDVIVIADVSDGESYYDYHYKEIAKDATKLGANGIVAPATKPWRIKEIRDIIDDDMYIISPGIKTQGGSAEKALESGTDYLIVVRDIMEAINT